MFEDIIVKSNLKPKLMIKKIYALALLGFTSLGLNAQSASPYCATATTHFNIPAEIPSQIYLSIANVDATSMTVQIESADADAVDLLLVLNGSGATISNENTSIPGKISRTLTWATPPATVDLNILWSKASFPGNWMLNQTDITLNFADTCASFNPPPPPPPPTPVNVTFQVDINNYAGSYTTVNVNGTFNGWCGGCNPMTDADNDGIYDVTLPLLPGIIEYKFTVDGWTDQENLIPGTSCSVSGGGYTNRIYTIAGADTLPAVCWNSCVTCAAAPVSKMVTFTVDMADYNSTTYSGVFLNGSFNGWCGTCNPMTDMGNDVWSVSIPLSADSIEYKFTLDGWTGQEALSPGSSCTKTTSGYTNRFAELLGDTVLNEVCWNQCTDCVGIPSSVNVTFKVNMNNYTGIFSSVNLNGTFNSWCGTCAPMSDSNGDGIYELSVVVPTSGIEYKFTVDGWNDQENLVAGDPCTITSGGYTNRFLLPVGDSTLNPVCWGSCSDCGAAPINYYDVTFNVNMNAECGVDSVDIAGDFNGWPSGAGATMVDMGNGSYSATLNLLEGTVSYKFRKWSGGAVVWESISNRSTTFNSDVNIAEVCFNNVSSCDPVPVISGISKLGNPRTYTVAFSAPAGQLYSLQLKGPSDVNWSTPKTWASSSATSQNFQAKVFGGETRVRIGVRNAGVWSYSCEEAFISDCSPMTVSAIELVAPFCSGDSAQLKAVVSGGFKSKTFMWSTGETTRFIYGQQGQTYTVVATDEAGCSDSASVTVSSLTTTNSPTAFSVSKPNAVTFTGTWTPAALGSGVTLVGYRMAYRQVNVGASWTTTALSANTTATVDFTGSGLPSANYEFTAFARVNDNGSVYNTEYACTDRIFYNGSGAKWDANSSSAIAGLSIYPNPTQNIVNIQSEGAMQSVEVTDMNGKRLMLVELNEEKSTSINLEALSSGIYLINVISENGISTERVSKL